ncbi:hypothetical protein [Paenibacillus sp. F411]|uniref:hypothetical protein n=1 Tax=Paenibacillus sp. F411 TaxID=2820239 RepID=UPI0032660561
MRRHQPMSFDDLLKDLKGEKENADNPAQVPLSQLFNDSFMRRHTRHESFASFNEKGKFEVKTYEDVDQIPEELFERHIARETNFKNWDEMLNTAQKEHTA